MAMVVRSNIMAINANRQLGMNNSQVGKSLEKLASGFRINRAGDDASGLAISEKMKAQIKGLETASANSQDGISLIQTAEGALTEVHAMLNRMVELAGKSANGTMDDTVDRNALQKELDSLKEEIDRIAQGTNFNGKFLLDGSLGGASVAQTTVAGAAGTSTTDPATNATVTFAGLGTLLADFGTAGDTLTVAGVTVTQAGGATDKDTFLTKLNDGLTGWTAAYTNSGADLVITKDVAGETTGTASGIGADVTNGTINGVAAGATTAAVVEGKDPVTNAGVDTAAVTSLDVKGFAAASDMVGVTFELGDKKIQVVEAGGTAAEGYTAVDVGADVATTAASIATALDGADVSGEAYTAAYDAATEAITLTSTSTGASAPAADVTIGGGKGLTLQVGDTADLFNKVTVKVGDMSTIGLGIDKISVADQDSASAALAKLVDRASGSGAINIVSSTRADLGALQNRLEYTINNLDVAAENMSSANSRIRDTDMAKQIMEYTKMNVLTQAAQAMLAQANQQPQSVLQLLQ